MPKKDDGRGYEARQMLAKILPLLTRPDGVTFAQVWADLGCSRRTVYRVLQAASEYGTLYRTAIGLGAPYLLIPHDATDLQLFAQAVKEEAQEHEQKQAVK